LSRRCRPLAQPLDPIALAELDAGEAAVIQLAVEQGVAFVGIDERKGRRAAAAAGLTPVGSLGLLGRAKTLGIVSAIKPYVDKMQASSVWFDDELVRQFLAALGE
jgi:predicted nucleic acid-binding protein